MSQRGQIRTWRRHHPHESNRHVSTEIGSLILELEKADFWTSAARRATCLNGASYPFSTIATKARVASRAFTFSGDQIYAPGPASAKISEPPPW